MSYQSITVPPSQDKVETKGTPLFRTFSVPHTPTLPVLVALACVLSFYIAFIWRSSFLVGETRYFSLFDDAMVSMTYARNLAEGHGLRWNVGETPVEGYTNFLWTLLLAAFHLLGLGDAKVSLLVEITGALCLLLAMMSAARIASIYARTAIAPLAAAVAVGLYYPLVYFTLRGMEVGFLAVLFLIAVDLTLQVKENPSRGKVSLLAVVLSAALLVRMDAVIFCSVLILSCVILAPSSQRVRIGAFLVAACVLTGCSHSLWRYWYYGDLLPNTYYLKMTGVSLWFRVSEGARYFKAVFWPHLAPYCLFALLALARRRPPVVLFSLSATIFLFQCAYSIYAGGDAWEQTGFANRYITVAMPFVIILCALGVESIVLWIRRGSRSARIVEAIGLILAVVLIAAANRRELLDWYRTKGFQVEQDARVVRSALQIKANTSPEAKVAVVWAGAVPYFSRRRALDILGKNDPVIARMEPRPLPWFYPGHNKWNYAWTIGTGQPDVIHELWFSGEEDRAYLSSLGYKALPNGSFVRVSSPWLVDNARTLGEPWESYG